MKGEGRALFSMLLTVGVSWLSATMVFPISAPLFFGDDSTILSRDIPDNIRSITFGIFLSCFPMAQFIFSPLMGDYADRVGRKKALILTLFFEFIGYWLSAIGIRMGKLSVVFIGRLIMGIGASNSSICLATIADISKDEKSRIRYFSYGSAVAGAAFVMGPFIGGRLSDDRISGWLTLDSPMWFGGALCFLNIFVTALLFKETLVKRDDWVFDISKTLDNLKEAISKRGAGSIYLAYFFFLFGWNLLYLFLPAILVEHFDANSTLVGNLSAAMGLIWVIGTLLINLINRFISSRSIIFISLVAFSISTSMSAMLLGGWWAFCFTVSLSVLFAASTWPMMTGIISNLNPGISQGRNMGVSQSLQSFSMAVAPFIGGILMNNNIETPFILATVAAIASMAVIVRSEKSLFEV